MWQRRILELLGQLTVGDGVNSIVAPRGHMRLWQNVLPWAWWRAAVAWCAEHPGVIRGLGTLQVVLGAWLCARASRDLD
jgi:hypothetical protein